MCYDKLLKDNLIVKIFENRNDMGACAAREAATYIRRLAKDKDEINILFAAAPSQNEFLNALLNEKDVPWDKVNAMQLDDYINISNDAPQKFANFLKRSFFDHLTLKSCLLIDSENSTSEELMRYTKILQEYPVDISFIGIGENAHIAFNDPGIADFNDPLYIKEIALDDISRNQQVNDGCFERIEDVPQKAITVTIPVIFKAKRIFCIVPGSAKAQAIYHTINSDITNMHPSTILREHKNATLYVDKLAAEKIL